MAWRGRIGGCAMGVVLAVLVALLSTVGVQGGGQSPVCRPWVEPWKGREYIVQMASYDDLARQEARVARVISDISSHSIGLEIHERPLSGSAPTDFVVLSLFTCGEDARCLRDEPTITTLRNASTVGGQVKRVHVNRPYTNVRLLQHDHTAHVQHTRNRLSGAVRTKPVGKRRPPPQLVDELGVSELWERGYKGQGVKVAIFDTGLSNSRFENVKQKINWTNEKKTKDLVGHGTFVASVIGGSDSGCPGLAPEAELYVFRTFTTDQLSFTAWFLDAFNYALFLRINVLNLSTGGPDFQDLPFVEKIQELVANGVIVVSAVGNNGPKYGTTTNPADQMEVIGVGGVDRDGNIAPFSSRGMTMWELPFGTGRVKPDIVALAEDIPGAEISRGCRLLSGTSVAAPIVSGAIAVLASIIPDARARWELLTSAAMKQILLKSADRLEARSLDAEYTVQNHIFEQGAGQLNITSASELVLELWSDYQRADLSVFASFNQTATAFPAKIDATDCPYMWPLCSQPLYYSSLPMMFNLTLMNPTSVGATFEGNPRWSAENAGGDLLSVSIASPDIIWPYYGSVGVFVEVKEEGVSFNGTAHGSLRFSIQSDLGHVEEVIVPVRIPIVPTPPKARRVLWDQFHNLPYPSAFVPRDSLESQDDPLDSAGDHPHTNFHQLWNYVISQGYFLEILPFEYSCLKLEQYGSILLVDPEEEFFAEEVKALHDAIKYDNVSLLVFADWYDERLLDTMTMFDTSTLSHWQPVTGGSNLPALNGLLSEFNIEFGYDARSNDSISLLSSTSFPYWSGSYLSKFPVGGYLAYVETIDRSGAILNRSNLAGAVPSPHDSQKVPVLGLYDVPSRNGGRIAVFGDSSCLDASVHPLTETGSFRHCFNMLGELLAFTNDAVHPREESDHLQLLTTEYESNPWAIKVTATPTPAPPPNLELRSVPDPDEDFTNDTTTATPTTESAVLPSPTSSSRASLLTKHSKVLRAMQQKPMRQSFCHFHRKKQCHEVDLTRVTLQAAD